MSVARKIALARQIEEMKVLVSENAMALPAKVRQRNIGQALCDERLERQRGILATLEFCQQHETAIREFIKTRGQQG